MKKISTLFAGLAVAVLMSTSAFAGIAQIGDVHGKVLVNHGKGFVPASDFASLNVGDKVMVGAKSFATLSYAGCSISIKSPTVFGNREWESRNLA